MPDEKTLSEYLVKVGYKEDKKTRTDIKKGLKEISSFILDISKKAVGFSKSFIELDRTMEKTARNMMTSKENAYALSAAFKSVYGREFGGLNDILSMTNDEYREFIELQKAYNSVGVPEDYVQTLQKGRDLLNEINKIKVMFQSGLRRVAYILIKGFDGPLSKIKGYIENFKNNLPNLMDKIGKFLVSAVYYVSSLVESATKIIEFVKKLPVELKGLIAVFSAIGFALMKGPIGWFLLTLASVLLLVDDYLGYKAGKKSFLGGYWDDIEGLFKKDENKESPFSNIKNDILEIWNVIKEMWPYIKWLLGETGKVALAALEVGLRAIAATLEFIADSLSFIKGLITGEAYREAKQYYEENGVLQSEVERANYNYETASQMVGYQELMAQRDAELAGKTYVENNAAFDIIIQEENGMKKATVVPTSYNTSQYVLNNVTINSIR